MSSKTLLLISALAFSAPLAHAQGSWARRIYYTDNTCSTNVGYQTHVYSPHAACPAVPTPVPINQVCENKSTNAKVPSSEGTGCDDVKQNSQVSDAPYFPPTGQGNKIPNANYLTVNQYNQANGCALGNGEVVITQTMYAADGKCYVMEPGMYFKAACNSAAGVVQWCNDDQCTDCPAAKAETYLANCGGPMIQGQPAKSICVLAAGAVDQPLPSINGTTLPSGTITQPVPASTATATATPTPSTTANAKSDAGHSLRGAFGAIVMGILGAFTF
ncbi:hypothetical protein SpCBS45565_g06689 [Spizellomyces sp. 'palustris']|nr:hypothetical protein SpCBS45565_g06689 [Spizellomyces sp. 'palustris']